MKQLRGVNLGGWLVLERWMTPSVFEGSNAPDEYTLCQELGNAKTAVFKKHRDNFITKKDFEWIAEQQLNAVRLPVGHWLFSGEEPFVSSATYVKKALDWAKEYELAVVIDLHTAPGSQNGEMHSGKQGEIGWHLNLANIERTIQIAGEIAKTYGTHPALYGIELLNEPHKEIPLSVLQNYYQRAYAQVRAHSDCTILFHDAFRPTVEWDEFIKQPVFSNVLLDLHLYQVFGRDNKLTYDEHIAKTLRWKQMLDQFDAERIVIGEWSRALHQTYNPMDVRTAAQARQFYLKAQQHAFSNTAGWFYWNYKTEHNDDWNYRYLAGTGVQ